MVRSQRPHDRNLFKGFQGCREAGGKVPADLRPQAEGMLQEMGFVLHLARSVKESMKWERANGPIE